VQTAVTDALSSWPVLSVSVTVAETFLPVRDAEGSKSFTDKNKKLHLTFRCQREDPLVAQRSIKTFTVLRAIRQKRFARLFAQKYGGRRKTLA